MKVYIDGNLLPKEEAKVSVFDHGFLYGDGVFEGIRVYNGCIFKLKEHIDRLYYSAHAIMLNIPIERDFLIEEVKRTVAANGLRDAYIRLIVSRGVGDLGLDPRKCQRPSTIIIVDKIKLYPEELYRNGLSIITVPTIRNVSEAVNPQIKSLNYLNNILAKIEAINSGYEEALMLNSKGFVSECTGDNIFAVSRGQLFTTPSAAGVLNGITAQVVKEIASELGMGVREEWMTRYDFYNAEEVFLTGTAAEIIPVVKIDGREVSDGKPGVTTKAIIEKFRERTTKDGAMVDYA